MVYAKDTSVSVEKTEGDIKSVLRRYNATAMATFEGPLHAVIAFEMEGRRITMRLPLPDKESDEFRLTPSGKYARNKTDQMKAWEQACRSRWRGLYLCIRAKLESVDAQIETFEQAFLAHVTMPDGMTIHEHVQHALQLAYQTGEMQPLLPPPGKKP